MNDWLTERYWIEDIVGKGSAATVYRVWDKKDGRTIALKRLGKRDKAGYERRVALFQQEYYTLVDLAHPFIIEVYDYGLVEGDPYYTMELLEGEELGRMAPLPWQRACSLLRDIASSLAIIHSRRMVHRDLSARNVRCNKRGRAKLIDFGSMVSMGAVRDVAGTAAFMAPEVVYAQPLEGRADLFSLGALAYWLLSGQYAYSARSIHQLKDAWRSVPRSLVQMTEALPPALDSLVMSMLSLDKLARPVNAAEVIERLTAIAHLQESEVLEVSQAYVTTPTVVGRERELTVFRTRVLSALRGRGSTVMLEGVSGVGRSRLLSSFVLEGKLAGATVLSADGGSVHGGDYAVISRLIERMLDLLPEQVQQAARPEVEVLGHVIPCLRTRDVELIVETDPERLRARTQRALQHLFTRVVRDVPLMIAVDDVHLCDEPSLAALATLATMASRYRLVLALTLNQEIEIRQSRALRALHSSAMNLELALLGASDSAWLVQSMFGDVANINIVSDWIYKSSRGNVRMCMELAQHLVDNNIARYQDGHWILPKDLREQKLPQSLQQALHARVEKLSPVARALAESLSLVTEYAPLKLEHYVVLNDELDEKTTFLALDELVASQILVRVGDHYNFSQPGFVDVLHSNLSDERRQGIHARLATAYKSGDYGRPFVLIHHLQQAGQVEHALEILMPLIEKTDAQKESYALPVLCYETALSQIENKPGRKRERILLQTSLVSLARRYDIRLLDYAKELEVQLRIDSGLVFWDTEDSSLTPSDRIKRCIEKAMAKWESTPEQERGLNPIEAIRQLLTCVFAVVAAESPTYNTAILTEMYALLGPFYTISPTAEFIRRITNIAINQILGNPAYQERLDFQESYSRSIPGLEEEIRRTLIEFVNQYYLAIDEAYNANALALERADRLEQDPRFAAHAWEIRILTHLYAGRSQRALACLRQKELLAIQNPESDIHLLSALVFEAWAYGMCGDLMGLKQLLILITEKADLYPGWIPIMLSVRGNYHLLRGELSQARRDLEKMLDIAPIGQHLAWHRGLPVLVETLIEIGEFERAREVAAESIEKAESISPHPEALRELYRVLALAEAKLGNVEQAAECIEATIEKARSEKVGGVPLGMLYETAARIAICSREVDRFTFYAKAVADIYGPGKNPALIAKYAQLMMEAERAQLPGQWRVQNPLGTEFLGVQSATRMLQLIHTTMSECITLEQGYEKAIELLIRLTDATHGYIYSTIKEDLRLMAPKQGEPAPPQLDSELRDYLASWHARRNEQQLETQTLASRTLLRIGLTQRSGSVTRDGNAFQPLLLWVENQGQPEVVCVAALLVLELPLEDLLWPFTSVIARYLFELRV